MLVHFQVCLCACRCACVRIAYHASCTRKRYNSVVFYYLVCCARGFACTSRTHAHTHGQPLQRRRCRVDVRRQAFGASTSGSFDALSRCAPTARPLVSTHQHTHADRRDWARLARSAHLNCCAMTRRWSVVGRIFEDPDRFFILCRRVATFSGRNRKFLSSS